MSELYKHLLIPSSSEFAPELEKIGQFFDELETLEALSKERNFVVITFTGKTRAIGKNSETGEVFYGPELKVARFLDLQSCLNALSGESSFDLSVELTGPTRVPPFELYSADNYATRTPRDLWKEPYAFSVRCRRRQEPTHFLHSFFGGKWEPGADAQGIFKNPWNDQVIETSAPVSARFWIEIGIGNWLMPKVTDSLEILDSRWVAAADRAFGVEFRQGCIRNDD